MKYGVNNVIGGFGRPMSAEEALPYALARTHIEHQTLRGILAGKGPFKRALEMGCGYGRNLPVLGEFADRVVGFERDEELYAIARELNPEAVVQRASTREYHEVIVPNAYDLVLTFTFLQHLDDVDLKFAIENIARVTRKGAFVILCEETDPKKSQVGCMSWSMHDYEKMLQEVGDFFLYEFTDRVIEPTFPGRVSGQFMTFKKRGS